MGRVIAGGVPEDRTRALLSTTRHRTMRIPMVVLILILPVGFGKAQTATAPYQLAGSFTVLSNSFNGVPGARQPLLGWDASAALPAWHNLRFVIDYTSFQGKNLGSPQHAQFPTVGAQYSHRIGRESIFGKMLFGEGWLNKNWAANGAIGTLGSFTMYAGGGIDTPLSRHFSLRVEGGMQYTNLALETSLTSDFPDYRIPGLPNYFGRVSMGLVWAPRLAPPTQLSSPPSAAPESEVAFEYEGSLGHSHIEAGTWWSYLHVAGIEYDRHNWGKFVGARMDYVAEILPITILRQPAVEDEYGDPLSHNYTTVPGLGVTPVGLRMLWRNGKVFKPFFTAKGGVVAFTQKALSPDGAYLNFTLQETLGAEVRFAHAWELRFGISEFHFSNARTVPSNPGLDEVMYVAALGYHLHSRRTSD
ncbi:MAG TPA: acyloxyacyl hydrolase [Acidobacteriaceae bacterium]|nr:acyloxyacyl hydrolase [Acidobacteriaceae bacterium]